MTERMNKLIKEKDIEKALVRAVKAKGGMCVKLTSAGTDGLPDRLLLMIGGRVAFVEVKAPKQKPRPLQVAMMRKLERLGFKCFVIDDISQIKEVLDAIQTS